MFKQLHDFLFFFILIAGIHTGTLNAQDTLATFEPDEKYCIEEITLKGNRITKDYILFRELELSEGDTLPGERIRSLVALSEENLLNTALFNFANIHFIIREAGKINKGELLIEVIERWYIWPNPIFEFADRNFNAWLQDMNFEKVNYGMFLTWENFRGRKEKLVVLARFGYDEKYNLFYEIPYINKQRTLGLGVGFGISQAHEVAVKTINDTLHYLKLENDYPSRELTTYMQLIYRPDIRNTHTFQLGYTHYRFSDTLLDINPMYTNANNLRPRFFSLYYKYKSDFRDFVAYPLHGYYFDVIAYKFGLGILRKNPDVFTLQSTFRKYWEFIPRLYFASLITAQFSSSAPTPYYLRSGLGYGRIFIRGYEYYVVEGQKFGISRSNIKFAIIPTRVTNIGFIPTERFSKIHYAMYINLFFDAGYVSDTYYPGMNDLPNEFLYGYGIGLDFVTYYDVVFRFEYSINKQNQSGFFVHFMAPI